MKTRETIPEDHAALRALYPQAFPDEDLLALLEDILASDEPLSLTAEDAGKVIGHVAFTPGRAEGADVALLGPLAVLPAHQKQGVGSALVAAGHDRLRAAGTAHVVVLGDPRYYGRFGFTQEAGVAPPYPLPEGWAPAWQGLPLGDGPAPVGILALPRFWMVEAYWIA